MMSFEQIIRYSRNESQILKTVKEKQFYKGIKAVTLNDGSIYIDLRYYRDKDINNSSCYVMLLNYDNDFFGGAYGQSPCISRQSEINAVYNAFKDSCVSSHILDAVKQGDAERGLSLICKANCVSCNFVNY